MYSKRFFLFPVLYITLIHAEMQIQQTFLQIKEAIDGFRTKKLSFTISSQHNSG